MMDQREVELIFTIDEIHILADALKRRFTQVKKDRSAVIAMAAYVQNVTNLVKEEK